MHRTAYLSTIHLAWPLDRQRRILGPDAGDEYVDDVSALARKRRNPAALKERASLLRPTSRATPHLISVAAAECLAVSVDDMTTVLAAAAARRATIRFCDAGLEIPPNPSMAVLDALLRGFAATLRRRGLHRTRDEIAEERRQDTLRRIEIIRPFWPLPAPPTPELLAMAGRDKRPMAAATAKEHLGSRPAAQRAYAVEQAREAGRAAARARKRLLKEIKGS